MFPFARFVMEDERPLAPRRYIDNMHLFSGWSTRVKVAFVAFIVVITVIMMCVFGYLEFQHPVQNLWGTTPAPEERLFYSLPPHKARHRETYAKNVFLEMLHQTHSTTNATNCWICGLLPSVMHQHELFISLPLSYLASCEAWFQLLSLMYSHYVANPKIYTDRDYEAILKYIPQHQGIDDRGNEGEGSLDPEASMNVYTKYENATWLQEEMQEFEFFNSTMYFQHFAERNVTNDKAMLIPIINATSTFCIQGRGHISVGKSTCNYTYILEVHGTPPLITPPNVYFVCGEQAYTWLPRGWAGRCYLSFLYPPVYVAPSDYHRTHQLVRKENESGRNIRSSEDDGTDQTETSLQQFEDFAKGLTPFWGPIFNSRSIRRLSRIVENVVQTTTGILTNITVELQATRLVSLQNRMVLDVILADRGGACRVIGSSCCVYIPDSAPTVHPAIQKLHRLASENHVDKGTWSIGGWFWGLLSTWGWKIFMVLVGALGVIFTCCLCLHCGPACCSFCAARLTSALTASQQAKTERQLIQKEVSDLMQIDEGIFVE